MPSVQDLFLNAAQVAPLVVATQAAAATRGIAAAAGGALGAALAGEFFDDDLDVGASVAKQSTNAATATGRYGVMAAAAGY